MTHYSPSRVKIVFSLDFPDMPEAGYRMGILGNLETSGHWRPKPCLLAISSPGASSTYKAEADLRPGNRIEWNWVVLDRHLNVLRREERHRRTVVVPRTDCVIEAMWNVPAKIKRTHVLVVFETKFSASVVSGPLAISGSVEPLGEWKPERSVIAELVSGSTTEWRARALLPVGRTVYWKWLVLANGFTSSVLWDEGKKRVLEVPAHDALIEAPWHADAKVLDFEVLQTEGSLRNIRQKRAITTLMTDQPPASCATRDNQETVTHITEQLSPLRSTKSEPNTNGSHATNILLEPTNNGNNMEAKVVSQRLREQAMRIVNALARFPGMYSWQKQEPTSVAKFNSSTVYVQDKLPGTANICCHSDNGDVSSNAIPSPAKGAHKSRPRKIFFPNNNNNVRNISNSLEYCQVPNIDMVPATGLNNLSQHDDITFQMMTDSSMKSCENLSTVKTSSGRTRSKRTKRLSFRSCEMVFNLTYRPFITACHLINSYEQWI